MGCRKLQINDCFRLTDVPDDNYTLKNAYRDFLNVFSFPGEDALISETNTSGTYLALQDGNKNIMAYIDASNGAEVANYEYSPFGKLTAKSGSMADEFNFKFSGYFTDDETGLVYFGYRYYDADMSRWINWDPISENGFCQVFEEEFNLSPLLYPFVKNNSINIWDRNGLEFEKEESESLNETSKVSRGGTGRGITIRLFNPEFEVKEDKKNKCYKVKLKGELYVKVKVLKKGHEAFEKHLNRYDEKWGKDRNNSTEREATIAHERDHKKTFTVGLWSELKSKNAIERETFQKKADAEKAAKKVIEEAKRLYDKAKTHSKTFDTNKDINDEGRYEENPF